MGSIGKRTNSFKDVIMNNYEDEIHNFIESYVEENYDQLDFQTDLEVDEVSFDSFTPKFIRITASRDDIVKIKFSLVVETYIEVKQRTRSDIDNDDCSQWLSLECSISINNRDLRDFQIISCDTYTGKKFDKLNSMTDSLVPYIYSENLDYEADEFLKKYYPEGLREPTLIKPMVIAERMGLKVESLNITKNLSVFGQVFFDDKVIDYYDKESKSFKKHEVKRGTIVIDPDIFFMRNLGSLNNTIIHECFHWYRHNLFFEVEKFYNSKASALQCHVEEIEDFIVNSRKAKDSYDWIEWQANAIAPRILMPKTTTKQMIDKLFYEINENEPNLSRHEVLERVICELADFFEVSKLAAKIRMLDLGYEEVMGITVYVDNHYVSNHSFRGGSLPKNKTFTISAKDSLFLYLKNKTFRDLVEEKRFVFVDNHYCINDSKYITKDSFGNTCLTQYSLNNMDECCLIFDLKSDNNEQYGAEFYKKCILFKSAISSKIIEVDFDIEDEKNKRIVANAANDFRETSRDYLTIMKSLPNTLDETLSYHMERKNCTNEQLEEYSLISARTISRIRSGAIQNPTIKTLVALCIGLQLYPDFSEDLLKKAGHILKSTDRDFAYKKLLREHYKQSIHECNEILVSLKLKKLSK